MAEAAEAVEAVIAGEAKLDAHELRADFPIFQQRIHGKPLAYLDSAVSAQKPRQVLDALRAFYETSYTNVHPEISRLVDEYATEHAVQNPPQGLGRPGEIQPVQLQALAALAAGDPRMSEREALLGLAVGTVTRLVDRPEAAVLVERRSQRPGRRSCSWG